MRRGDIEQLHYTASGNDYFPFKFTIPVFIYTLCIQALSVMESKL